MKTQAHSTHPDGGRLCLEWRLWTRGLALLGVLGLAKVYLAVVAGDHLFHTHWRVMQLPTLTAYEVMLPALCAVLVAVGCAASLVAGAASGGRLRWAILALALILGVAGFFTLAKLDYNYAHPVVSGVLTPSALLDYLAVDLFFNPPFAAIYIFVLALSWWFLARAGKEHWMLAVMGMAAAVYVLLNRGAFKGTAIFAWVLVVAGLGTVAFAGRGRKAEGLWFYGWVTLSVVALVALLGRTDETLLVPEPFQMLCLALALALFVPLHIVLRRTAGLERLTPFIPFAFLAFLLVADSNYPGSVNYRSGLIMAMTSGRYLLGECAWVAGLAAACWFLGRIRPIAALRVFDVAAVGLILVSAVDVEVYRRMGVRLSWSLLTMSDDPVFLWRTVRVFVPPLLLVAGSGAAVYVLGSAVLRRCGPGASAWGWRQALDVAQRPAVASVLVLTLLFPLVSATSDKVEGAALSNLLRSSPVARWWGRRGLSDAEFALQWQRLGMPAVGKAQPVGPRRDLNVVLILLESVSNPYLSIFGGPDETQPILRKYLSRMEIFPNFFSSFANSLHARFATFGGLVPPDVYVSYVNPGIEVPSVFEVLHGQGYRTGLFYSSSREYTRFGDYLAGRDIEVFHDAATMPGASPTNRVSWGVEEAVVMRAILGQLERHAAGGERFFLTYVPAAPHMPYDMREKRFRQFEVGAPPVTGDYSGAYKNSLLYMDWVLGSILERMEQLGLLDRTLVVITGDHGEMVGDRNGKLGHGWNLEPWLTNVPLILMDPSRRGGLTNLVRGSQIDILPTIADRLGIPLPSGHFYQGQSLDRQAPEVERTILLNSHLHKAIVRGDRYYLYDPDAAKGGGASQGVRVFRLRNEGVRLVAEEAPEEPPAMVEELSTLDAFQESLVREYSGYRRRLEAGDLRLGADAMPAGAGH